MLFNHGTTRRKGVMILLNPKLNYKIEKISQNKNGRFIIAKLIIEDTHFISVNVYSPNDANQQVLFFKGGSTGTRKLSVINEIKRLCEWYDFCDIWRSLNPDTCKFPWRDKSFKVQCGLLSNL